MKREHIAGALLILPVILWIAFVIIYPLAITVKISLYRTPFGFGEMTFVGGENYLRMFPSRIFGQSFSNSLIWTGGNLLLQLTIPLGIALLLNRDFPGRAFVRTVIFIPWIIPAVVVAVMGRWMFEPTIGILNHLLLRSGIVERPIVYLGSTANAMPTLIGVNTWRFLPFGTILLLAVLQTIPEELYDAARVDGASSWQLLWHLILPLVGPMIWFVALLALMWNFNIFDLIWLMTEGGPGNATMTLPVLIYRQAFRVFRMDDAATVAVVSALLLFLIGVAYLRLVPRRT